MLAGRRRPRRRDLREAATAALPVRARAALPGRQSVGPLPWLRDDVADEVERQLRHLASDVPLGFAAALARQRTHRCHTGMRLSLDALAASAGAQLSMPFRDDRFIAALAAAGGRHGFGSRGSALLHLAGHLLPADLLRRSDGADGRQAFFGEASRAFAERWSGGGVDPDVVDPDVLRSLWTHGTFPWSSAMLFQLAFAHDEAQGWREYEKGTTSLDDTSGNWRIRCTRQGVIQ